MLERSNTISKELQQLIEANKGTLKTRQVVDYARVNKQSALYKNFQAHGLWDDKKAADTARLAYAGYLMRAYYVVIESDAGVAIKTRRLVALRSERGADGPGMREITVVLKNAGMRDELLQTALMELQAFKRKYEALAELSGVWNAIDKVVATATKKKVA